MTDPDDAIAIQMYSLRAAGTLQTQLDLAASAGYRHVELIGSHLDDPAATRAALDARGLRPSSSHVSLVQLRDRLADVLAACRAIGIDELFMPAVPQAERDGDAAYWTALGRELGALAQTCRDEGVALGYHNHDWDLRARQGTLTALDLLFDGAAGSPLTWQVDVAWLVRAGADPMVWLRRHAGRITSAHAKDLAPKGEKLDEDGWADVGTGVLDWQALGPACRAAGARWLVAEHDSPSDPARFARRSHAFLCTMPAAGRPARRAG
jgi:sugar phosphate isomerase/epimerase